MFTPSNKLNTSSFIEKSTATHGQEYDYSKVDYVSHRTKVIIICKKHGEFLQQPSLHYNGAKCPKCAILSPRRYRKGKEHFMQKAQQVHGNIYDYSNTTYISMNKKLTIICRTHGEFTQRASAHICGQGCPKCQVAEMTKTTTEFIKEATLIHGGKYDYSKTNYYGARKKIEIICKTHGSFYQTPIGHISLKNGCPKCGRESSTNSALLTNEEFIQKAKTIHGGKYDYSKTDYKSSKEETIIICNKHGIFNQKPNYHLCGNGCPKCAGTNLQTDIYEFVSSLIESEYNNRTAIYPNELDIFIPKINLGIEVNGLYWHSYDHQESSEERNRHLNKLKVCLENNISLLQITEDEWNNKKEIIKSIIKNKLNMSTRIYARECEIYKPTRDEYKKFIIQNHIQGFKDSSYIIGLKHENKLVSVMSFNKHPKYKWEITRLATSLGLNIVGGASKLFSNFKEAIAPTTVLTYANKRFSEGLVYPKLGFKLIGCTNPNYCYVKREQIFSRQQFQKHKLHKILTNFNPSLSEPENMFNNGYRRMWDAGHNRFLYSII